MAHLSIDKNVPLPEPVAKATKYPWKEMEIGDSFFVEGAPRYFPSQVAVAQRTYRCKFTCRSVDGGWRVWRVA